MLQFQNGRETGSLLRPLCVGGPSSDFANGIEFFRQGIHIRLAVRTKRTTLASERLRVALLIESSRAFGRGLLFGVAQYVREHGPWSIFLLKAAPLSRSALERRFARTLSRSPKEEILRVRLNRARQLLVETDFPLWTIAEKIGLEHPEYLNVIFKKKIGQTPGQFRAQARGHSSRERSSASTTD
jgi:AraC-like DNA-binding protein